MKLESDIWSDDRYTTEVVNDPAPADVLAAIDALDGEVRTMVILTTDEGRNLTVGGGKDGYVVYATLAADTFANLIAPGRGHEPIALNIGGQDGDYRARQVVTLAAAKQAALRYLATAQPDPSLQWEDNAVTSTLDKERV